MSPDTGFFVSMVYYQGSLLVLAGQEAKVIQNMKERGLIHDSNNLLPSSMVLVPRKNAKTLTYLLTY